MMNGTGVSGKRRFKLPRSTMLWVPKRMTDAGFGSRSVKLFSNLEWCFEGGFEKSCLEKLESAFAFRTIAACSNSRESFFWAR
jgi:hypothetical protein